MLLSIIFWSSKVIATFQFKESLKNICKVHSNSGSRLTSLKRLLSLIWWLLLGVWSKGSSFNKFRDWYIHLQKSRVGVSSCWEKLALVSLDIEALKYTRFLGLFRRSLTFIFRGFLPKLQLCSIFLVTWKLPLKMHLCLHRYVCKAEQSTTLLNSRQAEKGNNFQFIKSIKVIWNWITYFF